MFRLLLSFIFLICIYSCTDNSLEKEISEIPIRLDVLRYDIALANSTPTDLPALKKRFPYLYPSQFSDSVWINKMKDTLLQELNHEVATVFPDVEKEKQTIEDILRHIKYYFPTQKTPDSLVTVISEVDRKNKVIYTDSLLLLALDNYLGKDHRFYVDIPQYIGERMARKNIGRDIVEAFAVIAVPLPDSNFFLSSIIYEGKKMYLQDILNPQLADSLKIGYTPQHWDWATANEVDIWQYFIEGELLFSTNSKLLSRFVYPAPFSKFYLEIDSQSSPRIGQFVGWKIVRSFMNNNEGISLQKMLNTTSEKLFRRSRYKPKK